jgi:hypothetical protein
VSGSGKTRNVACAGTVVAEVTDTSVVVRQYEVFQESLMMRAQSDEKFHPLCLAQRAG